MNLNEEALKLHEENRGKIEVVSKIEVKDMYDLAVVYTPGLQSLSERFTKRLQRAIIYIN